MKKKLLSIVAICLMVCMLLTGCAGINILGYFEMFGSMFDRGVLVPFAEMEYTRPDMDHIQQVLDRCCEEAAKETNISKLESIILEYYEVYYDFNTNLALAMIYYSKDLTDSYWEAENTFCTQNSTVLSAGLDRLYRVLAKCPLRDTLETEAYFGPGFFDSYEGESIYDEVFTELLSQEAALQNEYYLISGEAAAVEYYSEEYFEQYGSRMAQVFLELVKVRQQMAAHAGYSSYPEFAYDFHHARDYTPQQATSYLADVRAELAPLYRQINTNGVDLTLEAADENDTFGYVQDMASQMGGVIQEAFEEMEKGKLYDISYGPNKYNASFEVFLSSYYTPYIFLNPTGSEYDKLTFAHEFGHFCNDYASMGSGAGVDVAEIFSQGMEYLSLCYASDDGDLEVLKMVTCLSTFVEQSAYASFEHQVYSLEGEDLTVENIQALYETVCTGYGYDALVGWDSRDYVCITHFFDSPMYVISYVVSNDAALQLYQMEKDNAGFGLTCLKRSLTTMQTSFLAFLSEAGLKSPFEYDRLAEVKQTLQSVLN